MSSTAPRSVLVWFEDSLSLLILSLMALLPVIEILGRTLLGRGIPGSIVLVQHMTLWITILGAALATRSHRLLALSSLSFFPEKLRPPVRVGTSMMATGITAILCLASLDFVRIEHDAGTELAWGIPAWLALTILPTGFSVITLRLIWHAAETHRGRLWAATGLAIPVIFGTVPLPQGREVVLPCFLLIVVATMLEMPIFTAIGGIALLGLWSDGTPINSMPGETYRLTVNAMLPAIPLFALGGYLLAEGGASRRLMRLFTAWVGWMPGGLAVVTTLVLAFFTPLTGASGITIVAMGGMFLPVLLKAGYPRQTSLGLVTVSGSIGLLFFPSLPVFLYAFYAKQHYKELFVGGFLPGLLLVACVAGWAAARGWLRGAERTPFRPHEAGAAAWEAKWDLLLPVVILGSIIGGYATLVEAAALMVGLALLIECVVYRNLSPRKHLPRVFVECSTLIGGFMIILCVALGFVYYLTLAEIPAMTLEWVQAHIESPLVFLLVLNLLLIVVGALMDIYSAIVVVVPLITPIAAAYGIDPVHLGIIFLANMELGYLMPPMGENLFLSSYRFDKPLTQVYRSTLPYVLILLGVVLLITYVPLFTLGPIELLLR